MKIIVTMLSMMLCRLAFPASAYWNGISLSNGWDYSNGTREYGFGGDIHGENGEYAWIHSLIYAHLEDGELRLKHMDFSREMLDATFNWWALALYGDMVNADTFDHALTRIEDFYGNDLYSGGTVVENPNDFYMAFKISEVLLEDYEYVEGMSWYGWAHVSIDENLTMTLLDSGINLTGGGVVVGAIPEPSSALLLLIGVGLLAARRKRRKMV